MRWASRPKAGDRVGHPPGLGLPNPVRLELVLQTHSCRKIPVRLRAIRVGPAEEFRELVRNIQAGLHDVDLAQEVQTATDGGVTLGDDERIYFLRSNDVLVISASGDVVKRLPFEKPEPNTVATRVYESQGLLAIRLFSTESDPKTQVQQITAEHSSTALGVAYIFDTEKAMATRLSAYYETRLAIASVPTEDR